jgi:hypothetical protein
MTDIYSFATHVEVWLGKVESDFDELAMGLVSNLGAVVPHPEVALSKGFSDQQRESFLQIFGNSSSEVLLALVRLFKRPWWTRMWIVQEVSLATQDVVNLNCGHWEATWLDFLVAAYAIEVQREEIGGEIWTTWPEESFDAWQHGVRLSQCRNVDSSLPGFTLLELLHQHRDCAATDPRDKVYGVLGLAADVSRINIEPSYRWTTHQVYTDLFHKHVAATGSLDMICAVRYPRTLTDLPSWVPDWSTDQTVPGICINDRYVGGNNFKGSPIAHYRKYAASRDQLAVASFHNNTLIVEARHVGVIRYLGKLDTGLVTEDLSVVETFGLQDDEGYSGSASDTFNDWLNMVLKCPDWTRIAALYGEENVWLSFCRTLIGDAGSRTMIKSEEEEEDTGSDDLSSFPDNEDEEEGIDMELDSSEACFPSPADTLGMTDTDYRNNLEVSWGKRFAILSTGYFGIVPGHSLIGDEVVVVTGCSMPLAVRAECDFVTLIGETYFDHVMDGELMSNNAPISMQIR